MSVLCLIQLARWIASAHIFDSLFGITWLPPHRRCTGTECYEVFSCFGLKDTTAHVREPLASLTGLVVFPLGAWGAYRGFRHQVHILAGYLAVSAIVHACLVIFDGFYFQACNAYTSNVVLQTLVGGPLPPSPFHLATRDALRRMGTYPAEEVAQATQNFAILPWYLIWAGVWVLVLGYVAREAHLLGDLLERGPLGLGIHYGLGQWDEVINHDAIRRHKEKEMASQFIDDARLPLRAPVDAEGPHGYAPHWGTYGSAGVPAPAISGEFEDGPGSPF